MKSKKKKDSGNGVIKSVFVAYFILILHVLLIALLGILVLFFSGIVNYMIWIFLAGAVVIVGSGYYFYRRMKKSGKTIEEILRSPAFNGKSVEVSLMGGLASFKIDRTDSLPALESALAKPYRQLEDPDTVRIRELTELVRLLENDLITADEYRKAKQQLFKA